MFSFRKVPEIFSCPSDFGLKPIPAIFFQAQTSQENESQLKSQVPGSQSHLWLSQNPLRNLILPEKHFISLKISRRKDYVYSYDYGELIATDDSYDNNDGDSQDTPRDYDSVSYNQFFREVPLDYYYDPDELSLAGSADEEGPVREDYDYSQDLRTMSINPARALRKTF